MNDSVDRNLLNSSNQVVSPNRGGAFKIAKIQKDMDIRISTASKGQFLGLSDVMCNRWHTTTVKCVSSSGSLYQIRVNEFLTKIKKDQDLLNGLNEISKQSDVELRSKIKHSAQYL